MQQITLPQPTREYALIQTVTELEPLEERVRTGLAGFLEVGHTLVRIREGRGYRLRGHATFESYCEEVLSFSVRHGQRLIKAAETAAKVEAATGVPVRNESVARMLGPVANDTKTLEKVQARLDKEGYTFSTATANEVEKAVEAVTKKKKPSMDKSVGQDEAPSATTKRVQVILPAGLADICPHCHETPESYKSGGDGRWVCTSCGGHVKLGVVPAEVGIECKSCGAGVPPQVKFCLRCGDLVEFSEESEANNG